MLTIRTIIEIIGFPEKHVKETMDKVLEKLKNEKDIEILKQKLEPAEQIKQMWSTLLIAELKFKTLDSFFTFCFNYLPTTVEFMEKEELKLKTEEFNKAMNDMLNYMHRYHKALSNLGAQNEVLKQKMKE